MEKKNCNKIKYQTIINLKDKNNSLTKIIDLISENSTLLELGCSTGYMSKELTKKGCKVIGIELNKLAAKKAKDYCKEVIIGDIEILDYKKELKDSKFDYIIFADVLEHLKDPKKILFKIKKYLKKRGRVIISIPNIAHASIRLELLTGDFEYEETGILDETHLKFFTKKTIAQLLDSCGYYIENIDAISKGLSNKTIYTFLSRINVHCTSDLIKVFTLPDALAYQYVVTATKIRPKNYSLDFILSKSVKTINHTEEEMQRLKNEIKTIYNSRGWKVLSLIHNIRTKIPIIKSL